MLKKYIVILLLLFIFFIIIFLFYKSNEISRAFRSEAIKGLDRVNLFDKSVITEDHIKNLPGPVQKYLKYVGVVGREKVQNFRAEILIDINMGAKGQSSMMVHQYDFFDSNPGRLALMQFKANGFPIIGFDAYINGEGSMLMKPLGLVTVNSARGKEEDNKSAEAITLCDMCMIAPATLIDNRITWTTIDSLKVKAVFNDNGQVVSGILAFNQVGQLISFSTVDKYYQKDDKSYEKVRWSASAGEYKEINGHRLPTYSEAVWHFNSGDFCYGKTHINKLEYNCTSFK